MRASGAPRAGRDRGGLGGRRGLGGREELRDLRDRSVDSDGMTFRALSSGDDAIDTSPIPPTTAPFVLVHGIGTSHRYLSRLHAELSGTAPVHSVTLPGFGGQPHPHPAPSVEQMAISLAGVLERLGVRGAVLVGHSMGAQWVVELAAQRPDLARAVVIIGPVSDSAHRSLTAQARALALDTLGEPPSVNALVFTDYLRCGPRYFLREAGPMVSYPIERRVADLHVPLLVVRGGSDPIAGTAWCRRLRDSAVDGSLAIVPGHHHVVQHSAPRSVAACIRAFLESRVGV